MVRRMLLALLLCAALLLTACGLPGALEAFSGADSASAVPDLRLLEWPAMSAAVPGETEAPASAAPLLADLWLDASQVMGGINVHEESVYPHFSRKYREGGFHYRYGSQVGMYEGVLRCLLAAAEGSRVRVLRAGNERLPEEVLDALAGSDAQARASVTRDLLTCAMNPLPSFFAGLSAENMEGSFYDLGTPMLNRLRALDASSLENPSLAPAMADALDDQIAAIQSGETDGYVADGDADAPLMYALENLDLTRLSVITCDPATLRRLSSVEADGTPVDAVTEVLEARGVFDAGLCVQLYAFVLDYMGQMSSFGAADFAEPLLWGRLDYDNAAQNSDKALPMPRTLIMLVVGTPAQVDRYTSLLDEGLAASEALKGLRGPDEGQLTYTAGGQTVTQQPFGFAYYSVRIERPGWTCLTRLSEGAALSASGCTLETDGQAATVVLDGEASGASVTVSLPVTQESGAASADLSGLTASVSVEAALILTDTLPTTAQAGEGQVIALRDTQYVFTREDEAFQSGERQSPFTLAGVSLEDGGNRLTLTVSADEAELAPGYYRVLVSADLSGAQVEWEAVPWADGLDAHLTNEQISAWEQFAQAVHTYDGDSASVPRQLQHAWGPVNESGYHGLTIPDFPPVMRAPGLEELIAQVRAAANVEKAPLVRYAFDVFVPAGAWEGGV